VLEEAFSLAGLKAGLTLLVLVVVFGILVMDARRNRPDPPPGD